MPRVSQSLAGSLYNPPTDVPQYAARVAMERRYNRAMVERLIIEGCMRADVNRSGRGTVDRAPDAVNGTENRAADRWKPSRHKRDTCMSVTVPGSRFMSDGFRRLVATERFMRDEGVPFSPLKRDSGNRRPVASRAKRDAAATYAARLAAFGAVGSNPDA